VGAYGIDMGLSLSDLLDRLSSIDGDYDLNIINLYPMWAVKYREEIRRNLDKMYILDIPIQSGNERMLKLMQRFHNVQRILSVFRDIKPSSSYIIITGHSAKGFEIYDPYAGKLVVSEEDMQSSFEDLAIKRRRDHRMIVFG